MNISIGSKKSKKDSGMGFGLNSRGSKKKKTTKAAFGDSSSSSDDEEDDEKGPLTNRDRVNRQIAKEQQALRKRAQAAAAADPNVYDYDGAYDSFRPKPDDETKKGQQEDRKSRYIGDLLKAAKKREQERDVVFERKVAKEQAEEDAKEEFKGKEKFVTKAYKRKLEERKRWEQEEEQREKQEQADDVTKKTGGAAMANFYGNFNRNVAVGGKGEGNDDNKEEKQGKPPIQVDDDGFDPKAGGMDFLSGFSKSNDGPGEEPERTELKQEASTTNNKDGEEESSSKALSTREVREKKVAEARVRYLERRRLEAEVQ